MKDNTLLLYAGYLSGCCKQNIIESFFPLVVNAILKEGLVQLHSQEVVLAFQTVYGISLPHALVRSVLEVGVKNGSFELNPKRGVYLVRPSEIEKYKLNDVEFKSRWAGLCRDVETYFSKNGDSLEGKDVGSEIYEWVVKFGPAELCRSDLDGNETATSSEVLWRQYVLQAQVNNPEQYEFIASLYCTNISKELTFSQEDTSRHFGGLRIYLDAPIVLSLLGLDGNARTDMCVELLQDLNQVGCNLLLFRHTKQEVERLVLEASSWAQDPNFDYLKASPAGEILHEKGWSEQQFTDFEENALERKLAEFSISLDAQSYYDSSNYIHHESEKEIEDMICAYYERNGKKIFPEQRKSIQADAKSMELVYFLRKRHCSKYLHDSRYVMLTFNSALPIVGSRYARKIYSSDEMIPACVSMDFVGTTLWFYRPVDLFNYKKKQLIADIYSSLRPSIELCKKVLETLKESESAGRITKDDVVRLRTSRYTKLALSKCYRGEPNSFSELSLIELRNDLDAQYQQEIDNRLAEQRNQYEQKLCAERGAHAKSLAFSEQCRIKAEMVARAANKDRENQMRRVVELEAQVVKLQNNDYKKKIAGVSAYIFTWMIFGLPLTIGILVMCYCVDELRERFPSLFAYVVFGLFVEMVGGFVSFAFRAFSSRLRMRIEATVLRLL